MEELMSLRDWLETLIQPVETTIFLGQVTGDLARENQGRLQALVEVRDEVLKRLEKAIFKMAMDLQKKR